MCNRRKINLNFKCLTSNRDGQYGQAAFLGFFCIVWHLIQLFFSPHFNHRYWAFFSSLDYCATFKPNKEHHFSRLITHVRIWLNSRVESQSTPFASLPKANTVTFCFISQIIANTSYPIPALISTSLDMNWRRIAIFITRQLRKTASDLGATDMNSKARNIPRNMLQTFRDTAQFTLTTWSRFTRNLAAKGETKEDFFSNKIITPFSDF